MLIVIFERECVIVVGLYSKRSAVTFINEQKAAVSFISNINTVLCVEMAGLDLRGKHLFLYFIVVIICSLAF
jgi:hypothetical protein